MSWAELRSEFLEEGEPPPGWNNNPSAWSQRFPLLVLALTGLGIAVYLGLYQLHVLPQVWEPFFGRGSEVILRESAIARAVPDAWFGAFIYLLEVVFGAIGGRQRWRTHPWAVLIEAVLTAGMAVGGVLLTILQPTAFGHYCTLCLCSAACSVFLVGFSLTEALAALQHLVQARRQGASWWEAFWGESGGGRRLAGQAGSLERTGRPGCGHDCTTSSSASG